MPAAGGRPFLPLENVNTSYHSEFQQILSINVVGELIFKKRCQNLTFHLTILTEKKLQIDSKWSETRKKHETADPSAADRFPQESMLIQATIQHFIKIYQ